MQSFIKKSVLSGTFLDVFQVRRQVPDDTLFYWGDEWIKK